MKMFDYVSFGSSSFIFLIPFIYCIMQDKKDKKNYKFLKWETLLFILVISSYLCNHYPAYCNFLFCDHFVIILLSIAYFFIFSKFKIVILLCIIFMIDIKLTKSLKNTVIIAFISLNLFGFINFTRTELIIGIISFCIGIFCKVNRDTTCPITYPIYTTIWHSCSACLLLLASRSIYR